MCGCVGGSVEGPDDYGRGKGGGGGGGGMEHGWFKRIYATMRMEDNGITSRRGFGQESM